MNIVLHGGVQEVQHATSGLLSVFYLILGVGDLLIDIFFSTDNARSFFLLCLFSR